MGKKKFDYFDYFKNIAALICEAAEYLHNSLSDFNASEIQRHLDFLHELEHRADCMKHDMIEILVHEFITPIEREDIVSLAQQSDDVVDTIEDVLLRIHMFNVTEMVPCAIKFSKCLVDCAHKLKTVMSQFKNFKNHKFIKSGIVEVNNLESEGDRILIDGVRELSVSNVSDRDLFIWTDIFEHFEVCLDSCEDVADIIEEVIMKNT